MTPDYRETIHARQYGARLQQLRAQYVPEGSSRSRHVYYSSSVGKWISVESGLAGTVVLSYWASCPCNG